MILGLGICSDESLPLREHFRTIKPLRTEPLTREERDEIARNLTPERSRKIWKELGLEGMPYIDEKGVVQHPK